MSSQDLTGNKRLVHSRQIGNIFNYRDTYVRINWENIEADAQNNFEKKYDSETLTYGSYDYSSIMHYSRCAFSATDFETITPLVNHNCLVA